MRRVAWWGFTVFAFVSLAVADVGVAAWIMSGVRSDRWVWSSETAAGVCDWTLSFGAGAVQFERVLWVGSTRRGIGRWPVHDLEHTAGMAGRMPWPAMSGTWTKNEVYVRERWVDVSSSITRWPGGGQVHGFLVQVPLYVVILAMCVVPGIWEWRRVVRLSRARRAGRGACPGCGYDLRGSGERCPECGMMVPTIVVRREMGAGERV